jgi:hypothetical protein
VTTGERVTYGSFTLTFVESAHCPPDRYPGAITRPVVSPARAGAYRCGEAWSLLIRPPRALPYAGDDLDHTMRVLSRLAEDDGVTLRMPTIWRREDPWSG